MDAEIKLILDDNLFCRCGRCEAAVQEILRTERTLCRGAKMTLTRRRKALQRAARRPYYRAYDRGRR